MSIIEFPTSVPLERCLRKMVRVVLTTPSGAKEFEGKLMLSNYPWLVLVADVDSPDPNRVRTIAMSQQLPFIGEDCAILRILCGNQVVYANPDLPRPYPEFDIHVDADRQAINELRRRRFGPGHDFTPEHLRDEGE